MTNKTYSSYHQFIRLFLILCVAVFLGFCPAISCAIGSPDYKPNGAHPRIWLTPSVIADLKAKKVANTNDWQSLITRNDYRMAGWPATKLNGVYQNNFGSLTWPEGGGYAFSGYLEVLGNFGIAYQALKGPNYKTASATADDIKAAAYAQYAVEVLAGMVDALSAGEEKDGVVMIRSQDAKYPFNKDEATKLGTYTAGFKAGYSARGIGTALPLAYDWFYDELSPTLKTDLYKIMFRHIDWYRGVRSTYNNGVLIQGIRYHEDTAGACSSSSVWNTPNVGNPPDNCNINNTVDLYKQKGYSFGNIGTNFFEGFVGMAMLSPLAVYGDAPQTDADAYLSYAKSLWNDHYASLTSPVGFKGGDSPEGVDYNSDWSAFIGGILGLNTATGLDTFTGFDFPKEMARNKIHNTLSNLDRMIERGDWAGGSASWTKPTNHGMGIVSHVLRQKYPTADEGKLLQYYLNNASLFLNASRWDLVLFDKPDATTKDFTTEPLYYRAEGTGIVTTRSSWDKNATDTVVSQIVLEGIRRADHEGQDEGQILINRGGDRLLTKIRSISNGDFAWITQAQNSIVFDDGAPTYISQYQSTRNGLADPQQSPPLFTPAIDRIENTASYLYTRGEVSNVFKWNPVVYPYGKSKVKLFYRNVLHLRPGFFVVYDVTRSNPTYSVANPNQKSWYMQFEAAPTIDTANRNLSVTRGNSKLFIKGLYPSGGTYTDTDLSSDSNTSFSNVFHRVKYEPVIQQEYDQFLHVIEATASTASQTPSEMVQSTDGKMIGAYIKDATNPTVVMFSTDKDGSDTTGNITYTLSARTGKSPAHLIVHLPPNADYTFIGPINANVPQTYQLIMGNNPALGTVKKTSSQGVLFLGGPPSAPMGLRRVSVY
jgi:hypothetical protein